MDNSFVISLLNNLQNSSRENRQIVADTVVNNKDLFKHLVSITFLVDDKISIKAAWVLEWICTHGKLEWIVPHLDEFTHHISKVHFDSAIRPCAKICEYIAKSYTSETSNLIQKTITQEHIDLIVETGFDWLITPQKIAVRAYTMTTLYLFGLEQDWIHPELEHLIKTKIIKESKGYEARGKKVLSLIKKR